MKTARLPFFLLTGLVLAAGLPSALAHAEVTAAQAREMVLSRSGLIVVDVRECSQSCSSAQHVENAVSIPLTRVSSPPATRSFLARQASAGAPGAPVRRSVPGGPRP